MVIKNIFTIVVFRRYMCMCVYICTHTHTHISNVLYLDYERIRWGKDDSKVFVLICRMRLMLFPERGRIRNVADLVV